ncbi:LysR family transcriptional regulator [Pseudomonas nitroreducens]|uniref:LysR family transcriptional regulator n=1 Tax=Pseudomonas nitroreducens TaxID=46680 RepID=A0A5R9AGG1_PSENT|nr:LysR substrate-binding domain-containing protein [Pseudomonas nitroreducens]TLP77668.1 LysR family transcriptional regulator [Pseudomonas nitroreducens]
MRINPLPPLQSLVAFEASVRHASFTRAADELHLTQSAISRQVQQLEGYLGRPLFIREHRSLRLTPMGERYAIEVRRLLALCAEATFDVMKHQGELDLTVACSSGVASLWLTPRLPRFRAAHPGARLRLLVRDGLSSMSPAEFDVGLYYLRRADCPEYSVHRLFYEEVFPVCSVDYRDGRMLRPEELVGETLLHLDDGQRQWMSWSEWLGCNGLDSARTRPGLTANHYPQLVELAVLGQGVALGWRYMIDGHLADGRLRRLTLASASHGGGYFILAPADRMQNHACRLFTRWLLEEARLQGWC